MSNETNKTPRFKPKDFDCDEYRDWEECFDKGFHTGVQVDFKYVDEKVSASLVVPASYRFSKWFEAKGQFYFPIVGPHPGGLAASFQPRLYLPFLFKSPLWHPFVQAEAGFGNDERLKGWLGGGLGLRYLFKSRGTENTPSGFGLEGGLSFLGFKETKPDNSSWKWGPSLHFGLVTLI